MEDMIIAKNENIWKYVFIFPKFSIPEFSHGPYYLK